MEKLNNGQIVYILNRKDTDKTLAELGMIKGVLGEDQNGQEYIVRSLDNDNNYYISYPNSKNYLYMLTPEGYINHLNGVKENKKETIISILGDIDTIDGKIDFVKEQMDSYNRISENIALKKVKIDTKKRP